MKNACEKNRISPFIILPMLFFPASVPFPFFIGTIIYFCANENRLQIFSAYFLVVIFVFMVLFLCYLRKSREIRQEKKDFSNRDITEVTATLCAAITPIKSKCRFLQQIVSILLHVRGGFCKKIIYEDLKSHQKDYFYDILTSKKIRALGDLYESDITYWGVGIWEKSITFLNGVPLKIVRGTHSHVVFSVAPAEGVGYNACQLSAIAQLSSMLSANGDSAYARAHRGRGYPSLGMISLRLVVLAVIITAFCSGVLLFFASVLGGIEEYFFAKLILAVVFAYCLSKFIAYGFSIPYHRLFRKKEIFEEIVFLTHTEPFVGFYGCCYDDLKILFREEPVTCQELYFHPTQCKMNHFVSGNNSEDYVCIAMTNEKLSVLKQLYHIDILRDFILVKFKLSDGAPLKIRYDKNTHMLKKVMLAEDYDYTPEQLAAIERFNTLYP